MKGMLMKTMLASSAWRRVLLVLTVSALASGCAGLRVVDSDVSAFAQWPGPPPAPGARYRFERLPSQQAVPLPGALSGAELSQDHLEAIARAALAKVGLLNDPAAPDLNVQVSASTRSLQRYPYDGRVFGTPGVALGAGSAGSFIGFHFPMTLYESPLYLREVNIVMRDARGSAVVYETRAAHSGLWSDAQQVLPAMFDAALQGFPLPPAGLRRVNVEISR
jgi:hypothetical protein